MNTNKFDIEYENLEVNYAYGDRSWYDGSYKHEGTTTISYTLTVDEEDVIDMLGDILADDPELAPLSEDEYFARIRSNVDELFDKHYEELKQHYQERAEEKASEEFDPEGYFCPDDDF